MRPRSILGLILGLVLLSVPAAGQPATAAPQPPRGAPQVIVTDRAGQETRGRLITWVGSLIVIETGSGARTFAPGEALRLDLRHDSLKNGFLIGAALGWLGALLVECGGDGCAAERLAAGIGGTAIYGALGAGIDALIPGRTPLWIAASTEASRSGPTFDVSPRDHRLFVGWRFRP